MSMVEPNLMSDQSKSPRSRVDAGPVKSDQPGASTQAVHAGEARQKPGDSITDPIVCASTYTFANSQSIIDFIESGQSREEYGRYGNPIERTVESKLATLMHAEQATLFSSGMAAIVGLLMARLNSGDEVVFFDECYHRSREFCSKHMSRFGVVTRQVKTGDYDAMADAINENTRLLVSESPTNPHLSVIDLQRFADLGRTHNVDTMIDATLATPWNVTPLDYGIDYVVHSCTKYLGGHNDLLAGCVAGSAEKMEPVHYLRGITGGINQPQTIYLLQRGLKTFSLRMQRHNENGMAVARFLEAHPRVEKVYYPGLASHRDHETAKRTMRGFGGLVTFLLKDADWRATANVVDACTIPRIAPSLGGVESLIEQPLVMSYYQASPEDRRKWGIPDNMIRMSCGIEDGHDLIDDLRQALESTS